MIPDEDNCHFTFKHFLRSLCNFEVLLNSVRKIPTNITHMLILKNNIFQILHGQN